MNNLMIVGAVMIIAIIILLVVNKKESLETNPDNTVAAIFSTKWKITGYNDESKIIQIYFTGLDTTAKKATIHLEGDNSTGSYPIKYNADTDKIIFNADDSSNALLFTIYPKKMVFKNNMIEEMIFNHGTNVKGQDQKPFSFKIYKTMSVC